MNSVAVSNNTINLKLVAIILPAAATVFVLSACGASDPQAAAQNSEPGAESDPAPAPSEPAQSEPAGNDEAVEMSMYGGFEQAGFLGTSIPRNDVQTTTQSGDVVLYSGNQIVVFYGSNSWAYTRLGRIDKMSGSELEDLLGSGAVELILFAG